MPTPDLTVKATGYQWYWGYAYPDQKIDEYTSNVLTEDDAKAQASPTARRSTIRWWCRCTRTCACWSPAPT